MAVFWPSLLISLHCSINALFTQLNALTFRANKNLWVLELMINSLLMSLLIDLMPELIARRSALHHATYVYPS